MKIENEIKQTKFRSPFHKVAINLLFTASWLEERNKEYFKSFDITPQQFNLLRILRGQYPGKISVSEIKSRMLDKNSDVSRLIIRLVSKKFIIKSQCPKDKRAVDVLISDRGLRLLADIDQKIDLMDGFLSTLSAKEATALSNLLDKSRN